eukprot:1394027-Amorphochlora_amoeboformis.AAC.1
MRKLLFVLTLREVHIGADSRSIDRIVVFAVAICLYRQSSGGHVVYKKMKVKVMFHTVHTTLRILSTITEPYPSENSPDTH